MNINLHIERLVLDGISISPSQQPHLQATVESELTRMLTEQGMPQEWRGGGAIPQLSGKSVQLSQDNNPKALGTQIASAVYGGGNR